MYAYIPTLTLNVQLAELFEKSFTVHVTGVVVFAANVDPDAGRQVVVGAASQMSPAFVAVKFATAPANDVAASVRFAGQVRNGLVVSTTVTLNAQLELLPAGSVQATVTGVPPSTTGNVEPAGGVTVSVAPGSLQVGR